MEILIYIIVFIIGCYIGSFASLAIYRLPINDDIFIKHSYCPNCNSKLKFLDLIPIFSYVFLKGKCRYCGEKIRKRYFILEILSGTLFLLFIYSFNLDFTNINLQELGKIFFISIFFISLILLAGIDKENIKIQKGLIIFNLVLANLYILFLSIFNIYIAIDFLIILLCWCLYLINEFKIYNDKIKYIVFLVILFIISRFFVNYMIVLYSILIMILTTLVHKFFIKDNVPLVFYYSIYLMTFFVAINFIV